MKILLINPFVPSDITYGKVYKRVGAVLPPLGILYIAAILEKYGYAVKVIDANALNLNLDKIIKEVKHFLPKVVGITTVTLSYPAVTQIAKAIKTEIDKDIIVVVGGPHISGLGEETIRNNYIDIGVLGEGEVTFLDLADSIKKNNYDFLSIKGIIFKNGGNIVRTPSRSLIEDLDELPFPARHLLPPLNIYHQKAIAYRRRPLVNIFTARGCPFQCIFCSSPYQYKNFYGKKMRFHSRDYVLKEIEEVVRKYNAKEIYFADDTFNVDKKRVYELCNAIKKYFPKLIWSCNFEAKIVDRELLRTMKDAGCWLIMPGAESGSAGILKFIKKGVTLDEIRLVCSLAQEVGLIVKPSFMLGHPTETVQTIEETIRFAESLPVHYINFSLLSPLPGTELWEIADRYGTFDKKSYEQFSGSYPNYVPLGLTAYFLQQKQKEAHRRVYLNKRMILRHLRDSIRTFEDLRRYTRGILSLFC